MNGGPGKPRMAAKVLRERQTRMSCGRRRHSSANSCRLPANAGLGELRTAVNSIVVKEDELLGSSILSRMYGGARNEETLNFFERL